MSGAGDRSAGDLLVFGVMIVASWLVLLGLVAGLVLLVRWLAGIL